MNADALTSILLLNPKTHKSIGTARAWGGAEGKARYQAARAALIAWHQSWRERAHAKVIASLRAHVLPAYDDARRRASIATFDDLLRDAARLLRTSPAARSRLTQRWRVLLVDEVQDTDPVQAEVATLLTRAHDEDGPWRDAKPGKARLFVVGDPKQSIYRFRGADVQTFTHLQSVVARDGAVEVLTQNFRSVPGIVSWVNAVFFDLLDYTPQVAHRAPAALDPVVLLQANEQVGEIEAAVRHLKHMLDSRALVVDRESGALRPLKRSDVMFLLPAWRFAENIAARLRSVGIDCVVEGGDTFFSRDEVRLSLAALRAIVEPADTEAVAFVLRGLFGLSHAALAAHVAPRQDGTRGSLRFTLPNQPPGPVTDALLALLTLHRGRGARSLTGLLDELFLHTRALAVWKLLPDGASRLANLDKLAALVRKAEADTTSPFAAVEELRRQERAVKDKDIARIDKDGDAVRITSLFKAKGLEAPLVFVLLAARKTFSTPCLVDHASQTVALKIGELVPPGWKERAEQEKMHEEAERRRFMYVAATRARDQLVVCRPHIERVPTKDENVTREKLRANDLLKPDIHPRGLPPCDEVTHGEMFTLGDTGSAADAPTVRMLRAEELPPAPASDETFPHRDAEVDAWLAPSSAPSSLGDPDGDLWLAQRRNATRAATRGCVRWRQASGEPGETGWKPGTTVDEAPREERVGARGGRVIHAVMERLDLAQPHEVCAARADELVRLLGVQAALPEEMIERCAEILLRILKNPLVEKARNAPERWHEVPFTFSPRPGTVISGTIDLAFPLDASRKEWAVFDWKSRVPAPEDKLRARYVEQLGRYADALVRTLGDARVVQQEIVGPYPELGDVGGTDDVFTDLHGALKAPLSDLIARGAPLPNVGADIGEAVVLSAELSWPEHMLAVMPDIKDEEMSALQAQGWTVQRAIDADTARLLGLSLPVEDG
jgi:ATP-dependent exoDNAse (exonuclease V) beta subunit